MSGPGPVVLASTHRKREMQQYEGETINAVGEVEAHPTGESVLCLDFSKELLVSGSNKGSVMVSKYSLIFGIIFFDVFSSITCALTDVLPGKVV